MQAKATSRIDRALPVVPTGVMICAMALPLVQGGCTSHIDIPDQSEFASLDELAESQEPVARLYIAPTAGASFVATHAWFIVKEADVDTFDRWEVSSHSGEPYGYVRKNLREPEEYHSAGGVFVLAELIGEEARAVVEFINQESPRYPCRNLYHYLGTNCNTYAQWVLDQTGWEIELPFTALGKDTPALCW